MARAARSTPARRGSRALPRGRRRRGAALETALLDAAWDELRAVGYPAFTLEGVAARAGTSRPVLARRWADRTELVIAAIRHHNALLEAPDTGTLRGDVLFLLRQLSANSGEMIGVVSFVFADYFDPDGISPADLRERIVAGTPRRMLGVIERAVERGEVDARALSPRMASLPVDLVRHDLIMNQAPVPEETLVEIVDRIFLPLVVGQRQGSRARSRPKAPAGSSAQRRARR